MSGLSLAAVAAVPLAGFADLLSVGFADLFPNGWVHYALGGVLIGLGASWLSAWLAVKGMVAYLKRHGLAAFGGYRVGLAVLTAVLILTGALPT